MKNIGRLSAGLLALALLATGCSTPRITETGRTAVEQFLISTVVDRGILSADFSDFTGKKVYLDYDYLAPQVDKQYVQGMLELHLAETGIIVVRKQEDADILIQVICGVLATDTNKFTIGTPSIPIPVPDTSISFAIPEIPIFQKLTRSGYGRFAFNILEAKTRKPIQAIRGIEASTYYTNWTIFLLPFKSHDMPLQIREGASSDLEAHWQ